MKRHLLTLILPALKHLCLFAGTSRIALGLEVLSIQLAQSLIIALVPWRRTASRYVTLSR